MLKAFLNTVLLISILIASYYVYKSIRIPPSFDIAVVQVIHAPPSTVFKLLNDSSMWEAWIPWKDADPTYRMQFDGPPSGVGSHMFWKSKRRGRGEIAWQTAEPPLTCSWIVSVDDFGGSWTFRFDILPDEVDDKQVKLTWHVLGKRVPMEKPFWFIFDLESILRQDMKSGLKKITSLAEAGAN